VGRDLDPRCAHRGNPTVDLERHHGHVGTTAHRLRDSDVARRRTDANHVALDHWHCNTSFDQRLGERFEVSFFGPLRTLRGGYLWLQTVDGERVALLRGDGNVEIPIGYDLDPNAEILDDGISGNSSMFDLPPELDEGTYTLCTANSLPNGCVEVVVAALWDLSDVGARIFLQLAASRCIRAAAVDNATKRADEFAGAAGADTGAMIRSAESTSTNPTRSSKESTLADANTASRQAPTHHNDTR
jgi:hypothetical protein